MGLKENIFDIISNSGTILDLKILKTLQADNIYSLDALDKQRV